MKFAATFILSLVFIWTGLGGLKAQETVASIQWNDTAFVASTAQLKGDAIPGYVFEILSLKLLAIQGQDCDVESKPKNCWMIQEIPKAIGNLKHLQSLSLTVNNIQSIPVEITELKELRIVNLSDNADLSDVTNLAKIENLEELYLDGCALEKLPAEIAHLKKLRKLSLVDDEISKPEQARIKKLLPHCQIDFGAFEETEEKGK